MTKPTIIPGTFPTTSIRPELNDQGLVTSYTLLNQGDEVADLPVQVGPPSNITGFTTEDIINIAISRLQALNSAVASPLNAVAIERLADANKALHARFSITSNKVEVDSVPGMVCATIDSNGHDLKLVIHEGYLFAGYSYGELAKNINTGCVATYRDFADITEDLVLADNAKYIGRGGILTPFRSLIPRKVK